MSINRTDIISLIGMTGVGKTTIGKELAKLLGRNFFDIDTVITESEKKTPRKIFDIYGEDKFRKIETNALNVVITQVEKNKEKAVVSCGGGIVIRETNRELLKKYAYTVWLVRPIEDIVKDEEVIKRPPINGDIHNYEKIYKERQSLYMSICDLRIDCAKTNIESVCKAVVDNLNLF